jgi:hypothetical protein
MEKVPDGVLGGDYRGTGIDKRVDNRARQLKYPWAPLS